MCGTYAVAECHLYLQCAAPVPCMQVHVSVATFSVTACNQYDACSLPHHTLLPAFQIGQAAEREPGWVPELVQGTS